MVLIGRISEVRRGRKLGRSNHAKGAKRKSSGLNICGSVKNEIVFRSFNPCSARGRKRVCYLKKKKRKKKEN